MSYRTDKMNDELAALVPDCLRDDADGLAKAIGIFTETINDRRDKRLGYVQRWAELVSPYRIGEVLAVDDLHLARGVSIYSHRGKNLRVIKIKGVLGRFSDTPEIRYDAIVMKKDGTEGAVQTDFTWTPQRVKA
jgi:hypothetical protein